MSTKTKAYQLFDVLSPMDHGVDAFTGNFNTYIPIASLIGNNGLGPSLDINLFYSPDMQDLTFVNWGLRLSHYLFSSQGDLLSGVHIAYLSTGEAWSFSDEGYTGTPNFTLKLPSSTDEYMTITHKDGTMEVLERHVADIILPSIMDVRQTGIYFILKKIITATGHSLTLNWEDYQQDRLLIENYWRFPRLISISDESNTLLSIDYPSHNKLATSENYTDRAVVDGTITFNVHPNLPTHYSCEFQITEDGLVTSSKNKTTDKTNYAYEKILSDEKTYKISKLKSIQHSSGVLETLTYDEQNSKISTHTKSINSADHFNISYTYIENKTTITNNITEEKKECFFDDKKRQTKEILTKGKNTRTTEQSFTYDNERLISTTSTTYTNKDNNSRTEVVSLELDTLGNLIRRTENGVTTEWTYYRGMPKEETLVKRERYQIKIDNPLKALAWVVDRVREADVMFSLFDERGLTWGIQELRTVTHSRYLTNTGKSTFNLPVDLACPGDPNYFKVYVESEKIYTIHNGQQVHLQSTYFGYDDLPAKGSELKGPAVKPTTKLTISKPVYDAQGKLTSWQNGSMTLERTQYITDVNSESHGRIQSTSQCVLDSSGAIVADSMVNTAFEYRIDGTKITITSTITAGNTPAMIQKEVKETLTGDTLETVDKSNNRTTYEYDTSRRLTTQTEFSGVPLLEITSTINYTEASNQRTVTHTSPMNEKTRDTYDWLDHLIKSERLHSDDVTWLVISETSYDLSGRESTVTECDYWPSGAQLLRLTRTLSYDDWGRLSRIEYTGGQTQEFEYDPVSQQQSEWVTHGHHHSGTILKMLDDTSGGKRLETVFFTNGQLISSTTSVYDPLLLLARHSSSDRATSDYRYDNFGRPTDITVNNVVTTNEYPPHVPIAAATKASVSAAGNSYLLGDQTIDSLGRVTSNKVGDQLKTYTYADLSSWGKVSANHDARSASASIARLQSTFDKQTRTITETTTGGVVRGSEGITRLSTFTYSLQGLLLKSTDHFGNSTDYNYNVNGQLISTASPLSQVTFNYGVLGRLEKETLTDRVSNKTIVTSYTYDERGREVQRKFQADGFKDLVLKQEYSNSIRLSSMELLQGNISVRKETFAYTEQGQLAKYQCTGSLKPVTSSGRPIDEQTFTYGVVGNMTQCDITSAGKTLSDSFTYGATDPTQPQSAKYHKADGTSQTLTFSYDKLGFLNSNNGSAIQYNSREQLANTTGYDYYYDTTGRLAGCAGKSYYDQFFYKGDIQYARSGLFIINGIQSERTSVQINQSSSCILLNNRVVQSGKSVDSGSFELKDLKGTVIASYDLTSGEATLFSYTPFGYRPYTLDQRSWIGFNGQPLDCVTGNYHLGHGVRVYNPANQFFESPDNLSPFGPGGINRYSYCHNDPVNYSDPTGYTEIVNEYTVIITKPLLYDPVVQAVLLGSIGLVLAPFTGGASIGWTLAVVGLEVISVGFAIASAALRDSDPRLSEIFSWVSLGTGLVGAGVGAVGSRIAQGATRAALREATIDAGTGTRFGSLPSGKSQLQIMMDSNKRRLMYEVYSGGPNAKMAQIEAHGFPTDTRFNLTPGNKLRFFVPKEQKLTVSRMGLDHQLSGREVQGYYSKTHDAWRPKGTPDYWIKELKATDMVRHGLIRTEAEVQEFYKELATRFSVDIIRPKQEMKLSELLASLKSQDYELVNASFCRGPLSSSHTLNEIKSIRRNPDYVKWIDSGRPKPTPIITP